MADEGGRPFPGIRVGVTIGLALALTWLVLPQRADAHDPAWETRSYYMANSNYTAAQDLGCANGTKKGRFTLFFGAPISVSGQYGATLWGGTNLTVDQIAERVKGFVRGYNSCRSGSNKIYLGIGTSNSAIDGKTNAWLNGHGAAWAQMTTNVSDWANTYYSSAAAIYGAWDAEPSWSAYSKANTWMHGYDGVSGRRLLYANMSADGCPQNSSSNGACNNGWTQSNVYHLAWWHPPSLPIPQIYATSGANARQWQKIDEWGYHNSKSGMYFHGVMTQNAACGGGCTGTDNTPHSAQVQMLDALNSHTHTAQTDIRYTTDMNWHS